MCWTVDAKERLNYSDSIIIPTNHFLESGLRLFEEQKCNEYQQLY